MNRSLVSLCLCASLVTAAPRNSLGVQLLVDNKVGSIDAPVYCCDPLRLLEGSDYQGQVYWGTSSDDSVFAALAGRCRRRARRG